MSAPTPARLADRVADAAADLARQIDRFATRPVRIVAVTKRFGVDAIGAALAAGIDDIGENYAQELDAKATEAAEAGLAPRWHFIGHIQRNKVRLVAHTVDLWQTVDRARVGAEIAKRAPGASVLIQVNTSGADTQSGCRPGDVPALVDELRALDLDVQGLMTIGALGDPEATAEHFASTRRLADALELSECSMGMSDDLVVALKAGTTMIRVGTALFGPRPG